MGIGSKLGKAMEKSGIEVGFKEIDTWVSTGSYLLNHIISGNFHDGIPLGKSILIAGESGSGKSYLAGNIAKNAQDKGVYVVFLDTERALDKPFLEGIGIDTSEDKMLKYDITTIDAAKKAITDTLDFMAKEYHDDNRPQLLFVLDSLGMMLTGKEEKESNAGTIKGDMGQKAKALRHFYRGITSQIGKAGAGLVALNHTWQGSDIYGNAIHKINGGEGQIYSSSIVLMISKKELKESAMAETDGIIIRVKATKTRFTKPFRRIELVVPYSTGMDPYSGLLKAFVAEGLITQAGAWYTYVETGEKFQSKKAEPILDKILASGVSPSLNARSNELRNL